MTPRSSILPVLGLLVLAYTPVSQAQTAAEAAARIPAAGAEDELVSLLEFLGEFTTQDGEWVDPELLEGEEGTPDRRVTSRPDVPRTGEPNEADERCEEPRCE